MNITKIKNFYHVVLPGGKRIIGNFRTKQQAIKAYHQWLESKNQERQKDIADGVYKGQSEAVPDPVSKAEKKNNIGRKINSTDK